MLRRPKRGLTVLWWSAQYASIGRGPEFVTGGGAIGGIRTLSYDACMKSKKRQAPLFVDVHHVEATTRPYKKKIRRLEARVAELEAQVEAMQRTARTERAPNVLTLVRHGSEWRLKPRAAA